MAFRTGNHHPGTPTNNPNATTSITPNWSTNLRAGRPIRLSRKAAAAGRNRTAPAAPISIAAVPPSDRSEPARITVAAPAKINLALSVGPLRPDGFHELRTVFQAVD